VRPASRSCRREYGPRVNAGLLAVRKAIDARGGGPARCNERKTTALPSMTQERLHGEKPEIWLRTD
jgi:hypothetical protein